eukprot:COSAG06_NODE_1669_length_8750_cov_35.371736_14_plen_65_part_00
MYTQVCLRAHDCVCVGWLTFPFHMTWRAYRASGVIEILLWTVSVCKTKTADLSAPENYRQRLLV